MGDAYFKMLMSLLGELWAPLYLQTFLGSLSKAAGKPSKLADMMIQFLESDAVFDDKMRHMLRGGIKWANIWFFLSSSGWTCRKGKDLIDYYYIRPGKTVRLGGAKSPVGNDEAHAQHAQRSL